MDEEKFLKIVKDDGKIVMEDHIDAADGVHHDSKSHSGMIVTTGERALLAVSTKQKCISKSSTDSELIAVTDLIGQSMDLRKVAEEIIVEKIELIIYQDNESIITVMRNGTVGTRSSIPRSVLRGSKKPMILEISG